MTISAIDAGGRYVFMEAKAAEAQLSAVTNRVTEEQLKDAERIIEDAQVSFLQL